MRNNFRLFAIGIALLFPRVTTLSAQENRDKVLASSLSELGQKERIRVLVEMLASKNTAPDGDDDGYLEYPKNYDVSKQVVVYLAIQQLLGEGSAAFDVLIDHLSDKRYSYTSESGNGQFNHSVGVTCLQILSRDIVCYELEIHLLSMDQEKIDPWWDKEFSDWIKENKARPLWELQIEAIDRAIRFFETVDRDKAASVHPESRKKMPADVFEKKRLENLRILRSMRSTIDAKKQPYRPRTIENYWGNMRDLPWPTRKLDK